MFSGITRFFCRKRVLFFIFYMLYNVFNKKRDSSAATETISGSIHSKTIYSLSILPFSTIVKKRRYIMEEEIVIKENAIIRIYSVEEWKEYFNGKEYVSIEELINVNLMQFLMQRQNKVTKNEGKIDRIEEYGIV